MLRADSVSYTHGRTRREAGSPSGPGVHEVSLAVDRGSIVGILGPNGSGKTTLLRLLAGLLVPASGTIRLEDADVASMPRRTLARHVAVVPQETHLAFDFSVLEVAVMGRYPHLGPFELEGPSDLAQARAALDATGTRSLEHRLFSTLSGGEKQRVVIAGALAQQADLMLLDEPTASLDLGYQVGLASLLSGLNRTRGLTLVVATHDLNFAASVCQRLVLLRAGRVLDAGVTRDVLTADRIRALYGVAADVQFNAAAGHLTVVPLGRAAEGPRPPA